MKVFVRDRRPLHAKRPCRTVSGAFPVIYNSQERCLCSYGHSDSNIRYMRDVVIASFFLYMQECEPYKESQHPETQVVPW